MIRSFGIAVDIPEGGGKELNSVVESFRRKAIDEKGQRAPIGLVNPEGPNKVFSVHWEVEKGVSNSRAMAGIIACLRSVTDRAFSIAEKDLYGSCEHTEDAAQRIREVGVHYG